MFSMPSKPGKNSREGEKSVLSNHKAPSTRIAFSTALSLLFTK